MKTREGGTPPGNHRTEGHEGFREKLEVNLSRRGSPGALSKLSVWGYRPWNELSKAERPRAGRSHDHRSLNAGVSFSDICTPGRRAAKTRAHFFKDQRSVV